MKRHTTVKNPNLVYVEIEQHAGIKKIVIMLFISCVIVCHEAIKFLTFYIM